MEINGCLQRLKEGNHKQRFILYPSLPFPYNDCKVIGEGEGNHGERFIFSKILEMEVRGSFHFTGT
jgi:hypothetical protein